MILLAHMLFGVVGGCFTYLINHFTNRGPVFASSIVVLGGGLLLPYFWGSQGHQWATVMAAASYAGMASKARISNLGHMAICSILVSVTFVVTQNAFSEAGGRLGTIAAIAVIGFWGVKGLAQSSFRL